jgi:hypothetical protein
MERFIVVPNKTGTHRCIPVLPRPAYPVRALPGRAIHRPTAPHLVSSNLAIPRQSAPCQNSPRHAKTNQRAGLAPTQSTVPLVSLPSQTPPNTGLPDPTALYPAQPDRTGPCQTTPDPTVRYTATGLAPVVSTMRRVSSSRLTVPHRTTPGHAMPRRAGPYLFGQPFGCKPTVLGTPVTEADLSTGDLHPFIHAPRVDQRSLYVDLHDARPVIKLGTHTGNARHADA